MSTSEAAGVRLSIHGQLEYPFPDTFGYSAPTGFVSSFGIRRRKVERLPAPYGDCVQDGKDDKYIYRDHVYQPEGCHRSCFQHALIKSCSCGDPRLPLPPNGTHCSAYNSAARQCLETKMAELGDFHHPNRLNCDCKQPCTHDAYGVTYSCAKWPSSAADAGDCDDMHPEECVEHYKQQAAMLEIYYEQLNYESLTETEAYGMVNLIADFGGQLGLWMGISVITCMEFAVLIFDLATLCCQRRKERIRRKSLRKTTAHLEPVDFTKSDMY
uniref:Uncharacterized protein n=1 Tax=Plectus sambesii TaxID=2011161 RepID=A0A914W406_9BILA